MNIKRLKNLTSWLENIVKNFINESPENTLKNQNNEKAWTDPLVGFSSGADPIYQFYKQDIGNFYWTPLEIFTKTFPHSRVTMSQLVVVSWILPHVEATRFDNRSRAFYPSERWARARIYGEEVNNKLRKHVVVALEKEGYKALAPMLSPYWKTEVSNRYGYASNWSERHVAYASGLGTFGLCDGLITPKGKAVRCGSVVANIDVPITKRTYDNPHAYCLFFSKGICGKCILRCPVGAISKRGHDKVKCGQHLRITREYVKVHFAFEGYGCGLCQTGTPCEFKIPMEDDINM